MYDRVVHLEPIIECIPNISEGRNGAILETIVAHLRSVDGCQVAHVDIGYDAHRTVLTLIGPIEGVFAAIEALLDLALEHIDMRHHEGSHPRIGAIDVIPFVPLLWHQ